MTAFLTRVRRDETLYSAMARAVRYFGGQPRNAVQTALFGADLSVFDDMPIGLRRVVASQVFEPIEVADAVREWTLFPYYSHYASPTNRRAVASTMAGDTGWPHEALGSWTAEASPPDRLRFCPACLREMGRNGGDLWWRRTHQLPSALVCADHGDVLRTSTVDRQTRRRSYVAASAVTCPPDAPVVVDADPHVLNDLLVLARQSDELLNDWSEVHPDDRREAYLQDLWRLDLLNRRGEANLPALARTMDAYWGATLDLWPRFRSDGCCRQGWLDALLLREDRSPPLHHLLLEGLLTVLLRA